MLHIIPSAGHDVFARRLISETRQEKGHHKLRQKQRPLARTLLLASGAVAPLFVPTQAVAQSHGGKEISANDIIVTARRVEERLQDVPASITVFNQETIDKRNLTNALDLAQYTPSLEVNAQQGGNNTSYTLRGFVQDQGTAATVGVYFADVVAPRGGISTLFAGDGVPPGTFFDLQNVQVLKGPQGTLFGRNTTGGAILVVPQRPTAALEGYVEGSLGNFDMRRVQGALNLPVSSTVRGRFSFDRQKRDGYVRNTGGIGPDRFGDIDYWSLRGSLVIDLTPNLENYTVATYNRSDTTGDLMQAFNCVTGPGKTFAPMACAQIAAQRARGDGFYTVQTSNREVFSKNEQWQVINHLKWRATDTLTVEDVASYGQLKQDYSTPLFGMLWDGNDLNPSLPDNTILDFTGVKPVPGYHFAHQWTATNEVRLSGNMFGSLEWQGGLYLEKSAPLSTSGTSSTGFLNCTDLGNRLCANPPIVPTPFGYFAAGSLTQTFQRNTYNNTGIYYQGVLTVTDRLKLTAGARYTWDKIENSAAALTYSYSAGTTPVPPTGVSCRPPGTLPTCFATTKAKFDAPTWLLGLDFKATDDILLYVKYARGFRSGGINGQLPAELAVFQPEKINSYEGGIKTSFGGAVNGVFNLTGFYNDLSDQQLKLSFQDNANQARFLPGVLNAGTSRVYGFEIESSVQPFDGLTLEANYSYLKGTIRSIDTSNAPNPATTGYTPIGSFLSGDPLAFMPRNKYSFTGTYQLPLADELGRVSISGTVTHSDRQLSIYAYRNADGSLGADNYIPGRTLVNASLSWDSVAGQPVDLSVFVTNLAKRKYITFKQVLAISAVASDTQQLGQPRIFGVRMRYRFGQ